MTEVDCAFTCGNKWFRYRAGAIIRTEEKALFMVEQLNTIIHQAVLFIMEKKSRML